MAQGKLWESSEIENDYIVYITRFTMLAREYI